ncbi:molybdate transport system ATP-binding protein [Spirosomataceae bacterium TFI 002]|nr:molybdate transport system ATP-binding protein [Spirosomataceae bacterium TFI 002]
MIEFSNVKIKKGTNIVLKNISISIPKGKNIGIVGANASGKSTFLDAISGRIFPFQGKISKPHYSKIQQVARDYSFHRIVGAAYQYYQQRYQAYDSEIGPTVFEVLQNQVKPIGTIDEKSVELPDPKYAIEKVKNIAKQMNISHLLDRKVATLSNGETRRSLIAMALLEEPEILLLDNPFTGLDTKSKTALKSLLSNIKTQFILVASPSDFPDNVEEIIEFDKGEIKQIHQRPFTLSAYKPNKLSLDEAMLRSIDKTYLNDFTTAVKVTNGWVKYGEKRVLDNINWEVKRGGRWALMGPNGSGKSTLLSLIMADNPQAYQNDLVLFDQQRGTGESIWDLKKRTGFVSPELHLFFPKNQRVWKVVASGLFDTIGLIKTLNEEELAKTNAYLKLLNLEEIKERPLGELSTGEQRQVLLARALIKNPPLLVLDEPCQNLDYSHMVYFRELVDELVTKLDKTLIYVTHNLEEIPSCVQHTLRLEDGKVIS